MYITFNFNSQEISKQIPELISDSDFLDKRFHKSQDFIVCSKQSMQAKWYLKKIQNIRCQAESKFELCILKVDLFYLI